MRESKWVTTLEEFGGRFLGEAAAWLPHLILALLLLAVGWGLATLFRRWGTKLVTLALEKWITSSDAAREIEQSGARRMVPNLIGVLLFWTILLFFSAAALELLGLPVATGVLSGFAAYLPNVVAAVGILLAGLVGSILARSALVPLLRKAKIPYPDLTSRVAQTFLVLLAVITAIDQLGVDSTLLIVIAAIVIGTMLGASALAFALGARTEVSNLLASQQVTKHVVLGQRVRLADLEGEVVEIDSTSVMIQVGESRVRVPAKAFSENAVWLLRGES